ncbi:hypothetical protein [Nocardia sp. NPDC020380]|uniref:hypothetical protein n=1 Tax=Nocardia sp. NPDC020380 TaxID=3364309 RepID=UPI0037AA5DDD
MTDIGLHRNRSESPALRPPLVTLAYRAILAALLAGVAETILHTAISLRHNETHMGALTSGLLARAALYTLVLLIALRMAGGNLGARNLLIYGLGTVGTASLVIEPLRAIATTDHPAHLFTGWTTEGLLIGLLRTTHLVAVWIAIPAMLRAGDYFHPESARAHAAAEAQPQTDRATPGGQ